MKYKNHRMFCWHAAFYQLHVFAVHKFDKKEGSNLWHHHVFLSIDKKSCGIADEIKNEAKKATIMVAFFASFFRI